MVKPLQVIPNDGIALPDKACRILVIDGLPNMRSEYNLFIYLFIQSVNPSSKELLREQIQKSGARNGTRCALK